jgi:hypothetical protein
MPQQAQQLALVGRARIRLGDQAREQHPAAQPRVDLVVLLQRGGDRPRRASGPGRAWV